MPVLILQNFIERIQSEERPIQPSIYIELGHYIIKQCEMQPEGRLSKAVREKIARLLKAEIASPNSGLKTFEQFSALFRAVYARNLLAADQFERLALSFLNATAACMPADERDGFVENVNESIAEPPGKPRRNQLAALLDRICRDPRLGDLSQEARRAAISFLNPVLCIDLPKLPSSHSDERSLRLIGPHSTSDLPSGLIESRVELAELTRIVRWSGLSYGDSSKKNCILLVELFELMIDGIHEIDFSQLDFLNGREDIFAETATTPTSFYDGEF